MLNDIYKGIKERLSAIDSANTIQWYNVQYETSIAQEMGYFVEFPEEIPANQVTKDMKRQPLKVRIHAFTQVTPTFDGIPENIVDAHEAHAIAAKNILKHQFIEKEGEQLTTRLQYSAWRHWHRYKGWMVTFIEFDCKIV